MKAGRKTFHNTGTSSESNIAVATSCVPGPGTAAFDRDGHLLLVMVKGEYKMVLAHRLWRQPSRRRHHHADAALSEVLNDPDGGDESPEAFGAGLNQSTRCAHRSGGSHRR